MQNLVEGVERFQSDIFPGMRELFERLVEGQHPPVLFITCSDSRIDPGLLTQTQPGELFVLRNAGNLVPPYEAMRGGEAATIEYAVNALQVKEIIICGHSHCGAMGGLLKPEKLENLPAVKEWLSHAEETERRLREKYPHVTDPAERLNIAIVQNVLVQLENLRTHPSVASAVTRGALELRGWVYKFETGEVFECQSDS